MNPYLIPTKARLIILDAHDTILKRDLSRNTDRPFLDPKEKEKLSWFLREGFINFLDYFSSVQGLMVVISSDGGKQYLLDTCRRFGILHQLQAVYGSNHMDPSTGLKQVGQILEDLAVAPEEAVFIGDSRIDRLSAEKAGVPYVEVPDTLDDRSFTFNRFLPVQFGSGNLGLELQKIENPGRLYHNLSTPHLVELVLERGEGQLAHLGPLVINNGDDGPTGAPQYILREPSSEEFVDWESGLFHEFEMERFEMLYLRLLAFLQDRPLFVQDCFAGADQRRRVPLRLITQTAWHNLFARHLFVQANAEEMAEFFPEFTLIHVPYFKAIPAIDGTQGPAFVLVNLLKKLVLIGGCHDPGQIQNAVFSLLSFLLAKEDVVPIRCSSFLNQSERPTLVFGPPSLARTAFAAAPGHRFFGDDCHGWGAQGVYNIEWGCHLPLNHLTQPRYRHLFESTQKFAVLLQGVSVDENRRPDYAQARPNARASLPITHLGTVERSGVAERPGLIVVLAPGGGALPALMELSPELAVLLLLAGYQQGPSGPDYRPFYAGHPLLSNPLDHALLLWEKIRSAQAHCLWVDSPSGIEAGLAWNQEPGLSQLDPIWGCPAQGQCEAARARDLQAHLLGLLGDHRLKLDRQFVAELPSWAQVST
ncbi:MAG: phosphoenolpyruvate carboxykinase (ATP) [bacterium]|nr:phosphoenolpyruvate carboxykinase (ATP) [bacterium]